MTLTIKKLMKPNLHPMDKDDCVDFLKDFIRNKNIENHVSSAIPYLFFLSDAGLKAILPIYINASHADVMVALNCIGYLCVHKESLEMLEIGESEKVLRIIDKFPFTNDLGEIADDEVSKLRNHIIASIHGVEN